MAGAGIAPAFSVVCPAPGDRAKENSRSFSPAERNGGTLAQLPAMTMFHMSERRPASSGLSV